MRKSKVSAITRLQVMIIAAIIIIAAVAAGVFFLIPTAPKTSIKVGLLLPWSGAGAAQAAETTKGINVWAARVNEEGGLLGREIELVLGDTETDPAKGRIAFERLALEEEVDVVIGPFYSSVFMAVLPLMNLYRIPSITPMGTTMAANPLMASGKYVWRAGGNNVAWATTSVGTIMDVIVPALIEEYGMKEEEIVWQMIRSDDEAARDVSQWTLKFLDDRGAKIQKLDPIITSYAITDFTNEIRIIQGRKPDIVSALYWGMQSAIWVKQSSEYGSKYISCGFGDISTSPVFWDATEETRSGAVGMAYYPIWFELTNNTKPFIELFEDEIGETPSPAACMGYDACLTYEYAVKKADTTEKEAVADALAETDFVGLKRRMQFVTDPASDFAHDVVDAWFTMAEYQPTPSVIDQGTPLFNTTRHGLRAVLVWPETYAEGDFWIPDYYVPSKQQ